MTSIVIATIVRKVDHNLDQNFYLSINVFFTGITETMSTSVSSTAVPIPACLPSSSQSATANTMVAILHDYTTSQVSFSNENTKVVIDV